MKKFDDVFLENDFKLLLEEYIPRDFNLVRKGDSIKIEYKYLMSFAVGYVNNHGGAHSYYKLHLVYNYKIKKGNLKVQRFLLNNELHPGYVLDLRIEDNLGDLLSKIHSFHVKVESELKSNNEDFYAKSSYYGGSLFNFSGQKGVAFGNSLVVYRRILDNISFVTNFLFKNGIDLPFSIELESVSGPIKISIGKDNFILDMVDKESIGAPTKFYDILFKINSNTKLKKTLNIVSFLKLLKKSYSTNNDVKSRDITIHDVYKITEKKLGRNLITINNKFNYLSNNSLILDSLKFGENRYHLIYLKDDKLYNITPYYIWISDLNGNYIETIYNEISGKCTIKNLLIFLSSNLKFIPFDTLNFIYNYYNGKKKIGF